LLDSLGNIDQQNEYFLYAPKRFFDFKRRLPKFGFNNFNFRYDCLGLGPQAVLGQMDVYHLPCPDNINKKPATLIVTIHDLIYKTYPQSHTSATIAATDQQMKAIIRLADRIICISHSTRHDFHRYFDFPQERSSVVYNGVSHDIFYPLNEVKRQEAREELTVLGIQGPYILSVGTLEPRKNLKGILRAMAQLKLKHAYAGQLVVVGMKGWMQGDIDPLIKELGLGGTVKFLGFVSDDQLRQLYNCADIFVFPSFYEGFGFPILEAFACGVPVITSNTSSCGELANGFAITVDPANTDDITSAMADVLGDKKRAGDLMVNGIKRAGDFSFIKTAQETLAVYQRLAL
jgi:glycosyltransferase involved in cell wall biosynthesis